MSEILRESLYKYAEIVAKEFKKTPYPMHTFASKQFESLRAEYYSLLDKHPRKLNIRLEKEAFGKLILFSILDTLRKGEIVQNLLTSLYTELERSIKEIPRVNRSWAYLHQFDCELDKIDLPGPFMIRKCTFLERVLFQQDKVSVMGRTSSKFIVETKPSVNIAMEELDEKSWSISIYNQLFQPKYELVHEFHNLIIVLRLIIPSWIGISEIHFSHAIGPMLPVTVVFSVPPPPEIFPAVFNSRIESECKLNSAMTEYLESLWIRFRNVRDKGKKDRVGRILRAIRRFNNAIMSNELEDMIVDLVIGLEILFKTTGFRMTFLASNLVGITDIEKHQTIKLLDTAYRARSKVVHGGSLEKDSSEIILKTLSLVTKVLIFALAIGGRKELADTITAATYDSEKRSKLMAKLTKWVKP